MQYSERYFATEYAEQQFFASLRPRIERIVRRYVRSGDDDVEDLTQECLLRVYNSLEQLRDTDKLDPWLQVLVRNTVFTWATRATPRAGDVFAGSGSRHRVGAVCLV